MSSVATSIFGLVLCGGKSTRMGHDKGQIIYHSNPQVVRCYLLLQKFCEKVYISCRQEQQYYKNFPTIFDSYVNCGPISGILSAYKKNPSVAWFILACDLPFVNESCLEKIYTNRNLKKSATLYMHNDNTPEPMCTIWEPYALQQLQQQFSQHKYSLVQLLKKLCCEQIPIVNTKLLTNVNTHQEYKNIIYKLEE